MKRIELWVVVIVVVFALSMAGLWGYAMYLNYLQPSAYIEKIDKDGTVWVKLKNVSDNATIYLYYGDKVNSKAFWILK